MQNHYCELSPLSLRFIPLALNIRSDDPFIIFTSVPRTKLARDAIVYTQARINNDDARRPLAWLVVE